MLSLKQDNGSPEAEHGQRAKKIFQHAGVSEMHESSLLFTT